LTTPGARPPPPLRVLPQTPRYTGGEGA
jgi:hypothetical protein